MLKMISKDKAKIIFFLNVVTPDKIILPEIDQKLQVNNGNKEGPDIIVLGSEWWERN